MSTRDNWERLVVSVVRRQELWELCHDHSRTPSICSVSSDFSSSLGSPVHRGLSFRSLEAPGDATHVGAVWEKRYKPGVHVTLEALPDGTRYVKRVRFSRMGLEEHKAEAWWVKNRGKVYKRFNALGGSAQIRQGSVVIFSLAPLIDEDLAFNRLGPGSALENSDHHSSNGNEPVEIEESRTIETEERLPEAVVNSMNEASDLTVDEKIALQRFKQLVEAALNNNEFGSSQPSPQANAPQEVFIWGVKLLEDEKTEGVLLKFLRARDFQVKDAFTMITNTIRWRREFQVDDLVEEDLGNELERVIFMHGHSKKGHPLLYSVYGEFQDEEFYQNTFSNEEKRQKFLRWRVQFLEKNVRKLDFSPGGMSAFFQVNDLKNSPGPAKRELRQGIDQAIHLLQDNYPEFVAKQIFINVPRWYLAVVKMISPLLTQRTKSVYVFAGPSISMETLFKYISAEQLPQRYGGIRVDEGSGASDAVTEIVLKPSAKHVVEFNVTKACVVSWEVRVVGWEVRYGAEFVPTAKDGDTVMIEQMKIGPSTAQEQVISSSFRAGEPGKVVVTISYLTS